MSSAFTEEQIDHYLDYISIPSRFHRRANPSRDLEFLKTLHTYQVTTIPYENLSIHYSSDHWIHLDPQRLFDKVTANGRGGYCMENCIFFNHVLRALGFRVYMAGARIRLRVDGVPQGDYIGWYPFISLSLPSLPPCSS